MSAVLTQLQLSSIARFVTGLACYILASVIMFEILLINHLWTDS